MSNQTQTIANDLPCKRKTLKIVIIQKNTIKTQNYNKIFELNKGKIVSVKDSIEEYY